MRRVTTDEPGLNVKETGDSLRVLLDRAARGWLIILGNPDQVKSLEDAIYTPSTPKAEDVDVMLFHHPFGNHAWLARKNASLVAYLQGTFSVPAAAAKTMQVAIFDPPPGRQNLPGILYETPDGSAIALAGIRQDLGGFLHAYLMLTQYKGAPT